MFYYVPALVKVQLLVHNVLNYQPVHNCYKIVTIWVESILFQLGHIVTPLIAAPCPRLSHPMSLYAEKYQQCNNLG